MSRYSNYVMKNNVFAELYAPISSLATTIQLKSGQGARRGTDFPILATLEAVESGKVIKREIVKITARSGDYLTVVRGFAPCPPNDDSNAQGSTTFSFSADDKINMYVPKEIFDKIKDGFDNTNQEIDDIYNNGDHRVRCFKTTGLGIEVKPGNIIVGNTQGYFNGDTLTLTDNATNYIMITTGLSLFVSLSGRESDKARIAEITTANGEITNIKDMKIDTIGGSLGGGGGNTAIKVPAFENITDGKFCSLIGYCVNTSYPTQTYNFGTTTAPKFAIKCFGSGIVGNQLKLWLGYNGGTTYNIILRIESDNNGEPSGNLINNDAVKTIQKSNLTAAGGLYTITFDNSFAIPKGVNWIVLSQTANDTNYAFIGGEGMEYGFGAEYNGSTRIEKTGLSSDTYSKYQSNGASYVSSGTKTCTITPLTDCIFTGMNGYSTSNKFNLKQGGTTLISNGEYNSYTYNIPLTAGVIYTIDCIVGTNSPFNSTAATNLNIGNFIINAEQFQCAMPSGGLQIHYKNITKVNLICESALIYGQIACIANNSYDYITDQMGFAKIAASAGSDIDIITGGEYSNENLSIIPGKEYYLGSNGNLIDTRGDNIITVGAGISNNSIAINIKKYITATTDYVYTALFSGLIFIGRSPSDSTYSSIAYLDNNNATTQVLNPYRDDCSIEAYKGQRFKLHMGNTGTRIAYKSY